MKKNIFIIFITMSSLVFSQENIDEDFLMSLPSEIRNDFIKEMGENAQVEDQVFNPPNTAIRTLGANLQQIKIDLRNIEEELASKKGTDTKEITRFGANFFNTFQSKCHCDIKHVVPFLRVFVKDRCSNLIGKT